MKTIVVPIDFSKESIYALDFAVDTAKIKKTKIVLIHIIEIPNHTSSSETGEVTTFVSQEEQTYTVLLIEKTKERFAELCEDEKYKGTEIEYIITMGTFVKTFIKQAKELNADIIIMGTSGARGMSEIFIGSNSEKVVRHSPCPVITIREPMQSTIKNIVFASDFKNITDDLVRQLLNIQRMFHAYLHLVKVNTPAHFNPYSKDMSDIEWFIGKYNIKKYTKTIYNDFTEEEGIKHFAFQIGADIVALGTRQHTGVIHLLSESIAENVVNHSFVPVWTYKIE